MCAAPMAAVLTQGRMEIAIPLYAVIQVIMVIVVRIGLVSYQTLLRSTIDQAEDNFRDWNDCMDSKHQMNIEFVEAKLEQHY